jgi:acyl dehydratase
MTATGTVETIEELRALVGQELGVGPWLEITQERVNQFADVTGDHQWIHVDVERAKASPLGGPIAHGFLTLSLIPLLGQDRDGVTVNLAHKQVLNYGLNRVRFISPVKVGARVRMRTTLQAVEEVGPGAYQITNVQTIEIEGGARPAMVAESLVRFYF